MTPQPCPHCGYCPACGKPSGAYPYWSVIPPMPVPYWSTSSNNTTLVTGTAAAPLSTDSLVVT